MRKKTQPMTYSLIRGYDGAVCLMRSDGRHAWFHTGRRTLTGSVNRKGELRCLTAADVVRFLQVKLPRKMRSKVVVSDAKGIFDPFEWRDAVIHLKRVHGIVPVSLRTLRCLAGS